MNQKEWYMKILNWAETDSRLNLEYMDMVVLAEHLANEERGLTQRAVDECQHVWRAETNGEYFVLSHICDKCGTRR